MIVKINKKEIRKNQILWKTFLQILRLGNQGRGGVGLILPGGGKLVDLLVVAGKAVNAALNEDETELGVDVLAEALQVLAHGDSTLDEAVHVLGNFGGQTVVLQQAEDLTTSDVLDLGNTHRVTELEANHGGGNTLTSELADGLDDVTAGLLQPLGRSTTVRNGRRGVSLARSMHAHHFVGSLGVFQ